MNPLDTIAKCFNKGNPIQKTRLQFINTKWDSDDHGTCLFIFP